MVAGSRNGATVPYCASFSGHIANNRDLFGRTGGVRLFPGITGGSVWRNDWNSDPSRAPRVSICMDERIEATVMSTGNEFDGSPAQLRPGEPFTTYPIEAFEDRLSSCGSASTFFFGDPQISELCVFCSPSVECADPVLPPWSRDGLDGNHPLPDDFSLPDDWDENPSTEIVLEGAPRVFPNPTLGRIRLVPAAGAGDRFDLFDSGGRRVGSAALDRRGWLDLTGLRCGVYWVSRTGISSGQRRELHRVTVVR